MPPNIILLFPDQWRGDWLSHLGHGLPTPYTDQLAAEGTSFRRAYSPSPTCTPARAVLATGRTPWNCGRMGYRDHLAWPYRDTLQHRLCDSGYQTMQVGKTHYHPQRLHLGFEINRTYEAKTREGGYRSHYHEWLNSETGGKVVDVALDRNPNAWPVQVWEHEDRLHCTRWIADEAMRCIAHRDPTRPFFLQVGFHRPHVPFDPPRRCWDLLDGVDLGEPASGDWNGQMPPVTSAQVAQGRFTAKQLRDIRRAYAASIAFVDEQIGRILYHLQETGLDGETWIVLSSDHGDTMGDHGQLYKATFLEGSARVPLVVRPPSGRGQRRGQIRDEVVDLGDILPTCCAIAGVDADDVDGADLGPLLRGEDIPWRETWHGEHWGGRGDFECLIRGSWKYIVDLRSGRELLFDLATDPGEARDRSGDADDVRADLRRILVERLRPRGADFVAGDDLVVGKARACWREEVLTAAR